MSFATTFCRAALGIDAPLVSVETHLANGLPGFTIVGLPEKAVQEARERVRSALVNSGFFSSRRRHTIWCYRLGIPAEPLFRSRGPHRRAQEGVGGRRVMEKDAR